MYKTQLTYQIHLGWSRHDQNTNAKIECPIGFFVKEVDLPFPPFYGLQIQDDRLYTPPIKFISYNVQTKLFSCSFDSDLTIPTTAKEISEAKNIEWAPCDVEKYIESFSIYRINQLVKDGWEHTGTL
jgi:hypothetical protein